MCRPFCESYSALFSCLFLFQVDSFPFFLLFDYFYSVDGRPVIRTSQWGQNNWKCPSDRFKSILHFSRLHRQREQIEH